MTTRDIILSHYNKSGQVSKRVKLIINNDQQSVKLIEAWKHINFLYSNYILNRMDNILYVVYSSVLITKELWELIDKKYNI